MPNWVSNIVRIKVDEPKQMDLIIDSIRGDGLFQTFIPWTDEVRKDRDLERLYWWNWMEWRKKHWFLDNWLSRREAWYKECPYKQLWYGWQVKNWWAKRDFKENEKWTPDYIDEDWTWCEIYYDSPRRPHLLWRQKISEILWCTIEIEYSEPWCDFSWEVRYIWWLIDEEEYYNDAFFGHWKECPSCWCVCDDMNEDDWQDREHTKCIWCPEDVKPKKKKSSKSLEKE